MLETSSEEKDVKNLEEENVVEAGDVDGDVDGDGDVEDVITNENEEYGFSKEIITMLKGSMDDMQGKMKSIENSISVIMSSIPVNKMKDEDNDEDKSFEDFFDI